MDDESPVKDVGLAVDTGLAYSEDDYKGHRAAAVYIGFQVPSSGKSDSEGHHGSSGAGNSTPSHRPTHHRAHHKHRHHKRATSRPAMDGGASGAGVVEVTPSQRVQFILGGDEDEEHHPHQLFSEMDELRTDMDGEVQWKETARWVKFEEDVEEGGDRWSKPHVATLSLHSLFELRNCLMNHSVLLDADASSMEAVADLIVSQPHNSHLTEGQKMKVREHLVNLRHRHQHDKKNSQHGSKHHQSFPGIRSLSEIGKKSSHAGDSSAPNLESSKVETKNLKGRSSSQTDLAQIDSYGAKNISGTSTPPASQTYGGNHSPTGEHSGTMLAPPTISVDDETGKSSSNQNIHKNNSAQAKFNQAFMRKIPPGAEAHNVLVGEVDFLEGDKQIVAFVRLAKPTHFGDLTEVPIPTRFLFILLGAKQGDGNSHRYHEIGRSIATLMSDEVFHDVAYKAKDRADLLSGIDEFLDQVTVLPPGEWDPSIRIEPPQSVPSQNERKIGKIPSNSDGHDEEKGHKLDAVVHQEEKSDMDEREEMGLVRTGRLFGGLINDVKRKIPWYWSDYRNGISVQCLASFFFLYFACLTPIVTFGGLLSDATGKGLGAIESLLSGVISGVTYHLFSGQPLTIIGSTGPVLVFETICYNFCEKQELDYVSFRLWIGLWTALILFIMVAFDLSYLVCYITRFTEESFATLIAIIFIKEAFSKLYKIQETNHVRSNVEIGRLPYISESVQCHCVPSNYTPDSNLTLSDIDYENHTIYDCLNNVENAKVYPESCNYVPDVYLLSILLFFGTFLLAYLLKLFRNTGFFPTRVRVLLSDFAVIISIIVFVLVDWGISLPTPKLEVPENFQPTNYPERGWLINPLKNPLWTLPAAIIPALLATILIFMDQQITAVIVNRRENLLKKGCGYHLDLLIIAILIAVNAVLGLPWFVAATVLSISHVQSLRMESESSAPGEKPKFLGIRENRLTGVLIFALIGLSVLMTSVLKLIPMPVLYGVFLFMGFSSLKGIQLIDRMLLVFMPTKYQPDFMYLRHVRTYRVHLFTAVQVLCLALLWIIKSFEESSILFPLMVLALVGVRKLLDYVFSKHELAELDDIMPEFHKKEEAEKLVSDDSSLSNSENNHKKSDKNEGSGVMSSEQNKMGNNDINITDEISKTSNWKSINSHNNLSLSSPVKTDNSLKHRKHNGHHHHHHHHHHNKKDVEKPLD